VSWLWQETQAKGASASLIERSASNFFPQFWHEYSYNGIGSSIISQFLKPLLVCGNREKYEQLYCNKNYGGKLVIIEDQ
jgi:hypothetical protein